MQLTMRSQHIELSPKLRHHAERRLQFALGRYGPTIKRVQLRLGDVNGLIDRAADRVGRAVGRRLERDRRSEADRLGIWRSA